MPAERTDLKKQLADLTAELAEATTELENSHADLDIPQNREGMHYEE